MKLKFLLALWVCGSIHANATLLNGGLQDGDRKWVTDKNEQLGFLTDQQFAKLPLRRC